MLEVYIICNAEFITACQNCYIQQHDLKIVCDKLKDYVENPHNQCYIEFGNKTGNYTPAFSMEIYKADIYGHIQIEVDVEIDDNDERKHRSIFFVKTELGRIEQFYKQLFIIQNSEIGFEVNLNNNFN